MKATIGLQNDNGNKKRVAIVICATCIQYFFACRTFNNDGFIKFLDPRLSSFGQSLYDQELYRSFHAASISTVIFALVKDLIDCDVFHSSACLPDGLFYFFPRW